MQISRRSRLLRPTLVSLALATALHVGSAWAVEPFVLKDIRVEGLQRTDPGTVFASLPFRIGETYTDEKGAAALRALFASCAALVLPSTTRAEAFGYVQLEAMASGKPVIATDVPSGVSWVNQHERTGLIVRAGDVASLRAALLRLMNDPALRVRLGRAGRARVEASFTMPHLRERLRAFYAESA